MLFGHHVVNLLQQALWIVQKYGIQLPWRDSLSSGFTTCILPSNHLLFHLMDTYLPVPVKEGKQTHLSKAQIYTYSMLSTGFSHMVVIWDIQTGVRIEGICRTPGQITLHGDQKITLLREGMVNIYDGLEDKKGSWASLPSVPGQQVTHWIHKDTLQFATSSKTTGKLAIKIYELKPTSDPPLIVVESFLIPPQEGNFSFSPVSFHASFITKNKVTILDVQDSKILLPTQMTQHLYTQLGCFSPDGCYFGCGTLENGIFVWKSTPAGYISWSILHPRLPFKEFSFSPTTTSILAWGPGGIQLLHLENSTSPIISPNRIESLHQGGKHLVACSVDGLHIATAQKGGSDITVLNPLLGTPLHSIHLSVQIQDIKIVKNLLFMADGHKIMSWNLEAEGIGDSTRGATANPTHDTTVISVYMDKVDKFVLSDDCSHIAFTVGETVYLYNIKAQKILERAMRGMVMDIWFSRDGYQLCVCSGLSEDSLHYWRFEVVGDWHLAHVTTQRTLMDERSQANSFQPPHIRTLSEWVVDLGGRNLLWFPPNWRTDKFGVRWDGNFLALVGNHHQKPIIIELQPQ